MPKVELLDQAAVNYRTAEDGIQSCSNCANFQSPDKCGLVLGPVSASGICDLWGPMASGKELEDQLFGGEAGEMAPTQVPQVL